MGRTSYVLKSPVDKLPNIRRKLESLEGTFQRASPLPQAQPKQNKTQTQIQITQREAKSLVSA